MIYKYEVIDNGEVINTIVADEDFATQYAHDTGYILNQCEEVDISEPNEPPEPNKLTDKEVREYMEAFILASGYTPESEVEE